MYSLYHLVITRFVRVIQSFNVLKIFHFLNLLDTPIKSGYDSCPGDSYCKSWKEVYGEHHRRRV
jgi:hypothetical protein